MIKILPLLIFPILFLIFFINVDNLTLHLDKNGKVTSDINNYTDPKKEENRNLGSDNIEVKVIENIKSEKIGNDQNDENYSTSSDIKGGVDESADKVVKKVEKKNNFSDNAVLESEVEEPSTQKTNPEVKAKPDRIKLPGKSVKLQFGAFSKIKNAEEQKTKVNKLISKEFPEFSNRLKIVEENKLFKLILPSENNSMAKLICDYCKSKKMSCLILKK